MPARKPTVTGVDKQVGDPAEAEQAAAASITPTISASATASA